MNNLKIDYSVIPSSLYRDSGGIASIGGLNDGELFLAHYTGGEAYKKIWAPAVGDGSPSLELSFKKCYVTKIDITNINWSTWPVYDTTLPSIVDVYFEDEKTYTLLKKNIELKRFTTVEIPIKKRTERLKLLFHVINYYSYLNASITEISVYQPSARTLYLKDAGAYGMQPQQLVQKREPI